jgi:predicted Fe-Mo cluster-binding NifX family protein
MDKQTQLTLIRSLKSGNLNKQQQLQAIRALKSNADNSEVADLIGSTGFSSLGDQRTLKELSDERQGIDRKNFDYDTGADGKLRAAISFGETSGDKEEILKKIVGEKGFIKDAQGRLALTPEGQRIRGMEPSDKNIIIDEGGFSFRDIADFAGIAPEAILGTIGSVVGGTAGSIVPFAGTMAGAAIGGGAGSAAGQAIEEAIETMLGVQTQTGREVAGDVAFEGALGAGASIIGDTIFRVGRGVVGAGKKAVGSIKSPTAQLSEENIERSLRLIDEDAIPSAEAMGMPGLMAYSQKFSETITKDTTRAEANLNFALKKVNQFKEKFGFKSGILPEDVTIQAINIGKKNFRQLKKARNQAAKNSVKAVDEAVNILEKATVGKYAINRETMDSVIDAFQSFKDISGSKFNEVDDLLRSMGQMNLDNPILINGRPVTAVEAKDARIINLKNLYATLDDMQQTVGTQPGRIELNINGKPIGTRLRDDWVYAANALRDLDGSATFTQVAEIRKGISDALFDPNIRYTTGKDLDPLKDALDDVLESTKIDLVEGVGSQSQRALMREVSEARDRAMAHYREGLPRFEDLARFDIIRAIREASITGGKYESDQFFNRIVIKDSPEALQSVFRAVDDPETVRSKLSQHFINKTFSKSGIEKGVAKNFDSSSLYTAIENLGSTAPVLFGKNFKQIKKLAKSLSDNGIRKLTSGSGDLEEVLENALRGLDNKIDKDLVISLKNLHDTSIDLKNVQSQSILNQLSKREVDPTDVAIALSNPGLTVAKVKAVKDFFKETPEVFDEISQLSIERILKSVDGTIFDGKGSASKFKDLLNSYDSRGSLEALIGKEAKDAFYQFADDLILLGDVAEGAGSVAAGNIASHPIKNLRRVIQGKITSKLFANKQAAKKWLEARKKLRTPEEISNHVTSVVDKTIIQSPTLNALFQGTRVAGELQRQTYPRAVIEGVKDQTPTKRSTTPLPNVPAFNPNLFNLPAQQPTRTAPLSPIEKIRQSALQKRSLRDRAAQNPAVAASLLGGLGSASLLKS